MKSIIIISSIFYILGLKIGNKIDLLKRSIPVEKIITHKIKEIIPQKSFHYVEEATPEMKVDTIKGGTSYSDKLLKTK
ncbi:MAG: hypothetical protein L3J11_09130 [Draconibacterium sp.]|nr:hypothetical protein [Draconibacterium sp.]